jgi:hypothetical protein
MNPLRKFIISSRCVKTIPIFYSEDLRDPAIFREIFRKLQCTDDTYTTNWRIIICDYQNFLYIIHFQTSTDNKINITIQP